MNADPLLGLPELAHAAASAVRDWDVDGLARDVVRLRRPALVAVDGVDGAGKTTFARALAVAVEAAGRPVVVVHEDGFLQPRRVRHRRGRDSAEGFFLDSYDLDALTRHVLDPLGPDGDRRIRRAVLDHRTDTVVEAPDEEVPADAVVIVEGLFLHRDELAARWDWSVLLDVPFTESLRRLAERDGSNPDPGHPSVRRYVDGQRLYFASCDPLARATVVLDNAGLGSGA